MKIDFDKIPFVQAKHYVKLKSRTPRVIVLHSMEAQEKSNTAENVANYFANVKRRASAHYCIDNNSIVQCVQCKDIACGAPELNQLGIHLELAGFAGQSATQWKDEYSMEVLQNAAKLCAKVLIPKYDIAPRILTLDEVWRIKRDETITGFCTHYMGTQAFKIQGGHTDPGKNFPFNTFIELVKYWLN